MVRTVAQWLVPRVGALTAQPWQLTHGDWIPPNLQLTTDGWGVLDWEFCRVDPVVVDLGQSCCTILLWSGLDRAAERIDALVQRYSLCSGTEVSPDGVRVAMLLYWLHNYHYWRQRHEMAGGQKDRLSRQPGRLLAVGRFVGAVPDSAGDRED